MIFMERYMDNLYYCSGPKTLLTSQTFLKRRITAHPSMKKELFSKYSYEESRVVIDKNLITR